LAERGREIHIAEVRRNHISNYRHARTDLRRFLELVDPPHVPSNIEDPEQEKKKERGYDGELGAHSPVASLPELADGQNQHHTPITGTSEVASS
jgi:hypothetical protein